LLNKGKEPDGVVIIDEIDLHLHPSLESTVVNRLHRTFPKIQFILTTHSALVISNLDTSNKDGVRNNVVYKIAQGWLSPQALPNLNGIDATATIRDFMDSPARNVRYEELMSRYIDLFSRDKLEDAEKVYSILVREFGDTENLHRDIEERKEEL
jgi:predicted ATP-binding protein involved in virulence